MMAELLPTGFIFHQSNLQAFENCHFSFYLRYVRKLPWPAPLAERKVTFEKDVAAGSMFHSLVHQFFLDLEPDLVVPCAREFPDERLSLWIDNFLRSQYAKIVPNQFAEHISRIDLDGNLLLAKFDLLRVEQDTLEIFDWKSSRVLPKRNQLERRIQTQVYPLVAAMTQAHNPALVRMHYWEAGFPDQPITFAFDQKAIELHRNKIAGLITLIRSLDADEFLRTTNLKKCAFCEYQSYCARVGAEGDQESYADWVDMGLSEPEG